MIYLIVGENSEKKEEKIQSLKKQFLQSPDSNLFDYEVFYGEKVDPQALRASLLALPILGGKRVVMVRHFTALNERCRNIVTEAAATSQDHCVLILEDEEVEAKSAFVRKLVGPVEVIDFKKEKKANVFNMTDALARRDPAGALHILDGLLADGAHPLQIMGGVVWFWRNRQGRTAQARYEKGLLFLQEADLNIKRSRLRPEYALEMLIVQLGGLV